MHRLTQAVSPPPNLDVCINNPHMSLERIVWTSSQDARPLIRKYSRSTLEECRCCILFHCNLRHTSCRDQPASSGSVQRPTVLHYINSFSGSSGSYTQLNNATSSSHASERCRWNKVGDRALSPSKRIGMEGTNRILLIS